MHSIFTNAVIVLADDILAGSLVQQGGVITRVDPGRTTRGGALDMEGDYLLPGAVDLHTDNLERMVQPRPGARWPSRSALLAHDSACAAAGVTTVLDSLCIGDLGFDEDRPRTTADGIADITAMAPTGLLKAEHYLHLRCELPAPGMPALMAPLLDHKLLRLVSLMDHTPGTGQYADMVRYRAMRLRDGEPAATIESRIGLLQAQQARERGPNRAALLGMLAGRVTLASHDDRTVAEVAENLAAGIGVAEFPVTMAAAEAARAGGQAVIAGAPNLVRGGSHTGNVAVVEMLRRGLVTALTSDYVPPSLLDAAFMAVGLVGMPLPAAIALVTDAPARMVGLADRGRIAPGLRADLVRVRVHEGVPVVRQVWRAGERVV